MNNPYLETLLTRFENQAEHIKKTFFKLDGNSLNWKVNVESWSTGQCLEHLLLTNKSYLPRYRDVIKGRRISFLQLIPFLPTLWGTMILKAVDPHKVKKSNTLSLWQPARSSIENSIVQEYLDSQKEIAELFKESDSLDHLKTIICSPLYCSPGGYSGQTGF